MVNFLNVRWPREKISTWDASPVAGGPVAAAPRRNDATVAEMDSFTVACEFEAEFKFDILCTDKPASQHAETG